MKKLLFSLFVISFTTVNFTYGNQGNNFLQQIAATNRQAQPTILPSLLYKNLEIKLREQPNIAPAQLAKIANRVVKQDGFNYDFDVCKIVEVNKNAKILRSGYPELKRYLYPLTLVSGEKKTFQIISEDVGGPCVECFFSIPCLQVTKKELTLLASGKAFQVRRPANFHLDEVALVDRTMKKVLRRWEVPYPAVPAGISEDGTKLYLKSEIESLVMEISESGVLFKTLDEVNLRPEGIWLETQPANPKNDYSFMMFRTGKKKQVLRFSAPCT